MEKCAVKPYKGKDKYIFVCYSHGDKQYAFPIIERLVKDGYRVWFDDGIDPGTEWVENIAKRINECSACIALISNRAVNSHNCRQEINFAIRKRKHFMSVMLEKVDAMSLGMEMQLSALQAIYKYTLENENEFFDKFYEADFVKECYEKPVRTITKEEQAPAKYFLIRTKSNEKIEVGLNGVALGRSEGMCQYVIRDNSTIGRCHAKLVTDGKSCRLLDNNSVNGTFINGYKLESGKEYLLNDNDQIALSNELFTFHVGQE